MYIYPENMKSRGSLLLWRLWDLAWIVTGIIVSVIILAAARTYMPLVAVSAYAFLSIRFEDMCVFDYIVYAFRYCVSTQQLFYWGLGEGE